jgi:hypothetical protein
MGPTAVRGARPCASRRQPRTRSQGGRDRHFQGVAGLAPLLRTARFQPENTVVGAHPPWVAFDEAERAPYRPAEQGPTVAGADADAYSTRAVPHSAGSRRLS